MKFCGIMLKLMLIIASLEINDSKLASEIKSCKHYTGIFFFQKKEKMFNPLFMNVIINMKKNWQIRYIFFKTQTCNLFVKKNVKIFVVYFKKYLIQN